MIYQESTKSIVSVFGLETNVSTGIHAVDPLLILVIFNKWRDYHSIIIQLPIKQPIIERILVLSVSNQYETKSQKLFRMKVGSIQPSSSSILVVECEHIIPATENIFGLSIQHLQQQIDQVVIFESITQIKSYHSFGISASFIHKTILSLYVVDVEPLWEGITKFGLTVDSILPTVESITVFQQHNLTRQTQPLFVVGYEHILSKHSSRLFGINFYVGGKEIIDIFVLEYSPIWNDIAYVFTISHPRLSKSRSRQERKRQAKMEKQRMIAKTKQKEINRKDKLIADQRKAHERMGVVYK